MQVLMLGQPQDWVLLDLGGEHGGVRHRRTQRSGLGANTPVRQSKH